MFTKGKGNSRVGKYYYVTRNCLKRCLRDLLCDVLLMLVLMYRLLSVTPFVAIGRKGFKIGSYKDLAQFTANLVTRMLWFLRPKTFL
jgi:hypothetical protein